MNLSADLLWRDITIFGELHRKSASTLMAVASGLRRRPLPGVEEFFNCYAMVIAQDPATFSQVWTAPIAFAWAHRAYDLMRMLHAGQSDVAQMLIGHLNGFKLFSIGVALTAGIDLRFSQPFVAQYPITIPGTKLVFSPKTTAVVHGVGSDHLLVSSRGTRAPVAMYPGSMVGDAELRVMPVAGCGDDQFPLGAEIFDLPGVETMGARGAVPPNPSYQVECLPVINSALATLGRHQPETFAQLKAALRGIALKPRHAGEFQGISFSDFPGAFIVSFIPHAYLMAESIVHEFHHNRLFAIESSIPLVEENGATAPLHYSPFRPDPRPIRGLLHGFYVFVAVWRFWNQVRSTVGLDPLLHAFAVDRIFRIAFQLAIARRQLSVHGGLTEAGRTVLALLEREVDDIAMQVDQVGRPADLPAVFCDEGGNLRIETDERTGATLTLADALQSLEYRFSSAAVNWSASSSMGQDYSLS